MSFDSDTLTAIQTEITNRLAAGGVESYSNDGTSLSAVPLVTLFEWELKYKQRVNAENKTSTVRLAGLLPRR